MSLLPTTTASFSSGATEAQFKTFLSGIRDYLNGLFGSSGTVAGALTALGLEDVLHKSGGTMTGDLVVTRSAAPNTGVVYLGNGSRYLFFNGTNYDMPGADLALNGRMINASISSLRDSQGGVGCFKLLTVIGNFACVVGTVYDTTYLRGSTIGPSGAVVSSGEIVPGSWRCINGFPSNSGSSGLFQRIA